VRRNSIPLLGKFVPKKLNDTIYEKGVKSINILLDEDAQDQALYYTMQYQNQGITTKNIKPSDKDAGEMGFSQVNKILKNTEETEFSDIISQKLKGL
jgi:ArsR family metal-binding transcriptional regulator